MKTGAMGARFRVERQRYWKSINTFIAFERSLALSSSSP
jgi:hypothetical protein